jgi:nucleoside-diphosphate-sugar epimerase
LGCEQTLLKSLPFATVLRFGGLVGGTRRIGNFLAGKRDLSEPDRPVNLIHRDDCLGIVLALIEQPAPGIFNAVCDGHPTRRDLYTYEAKRAGLTPPQFKTASSAGDGRIVSNEKIKRVLGYTFRHPDPFHFPSS